MKAAIQTFFLSFLCNGKKPKSQHQEKSISEQNASEDYVSLNYLNKTKQVLQIKSMSPA